MFQTVYCLIVTFLVSVVFSRKTVQIVIFKVEYLENGSANFNDFSLILQDFERPFRYYPTALLFAQEVYF